MTLDQTLFFIEEEIKTQLSTVRRKLELSFAGINETENTAMEIVSVRVVAKDHDENVDIHVNSRVYRGNRRYDYSQTKQKKIITWMYLQTIKLIWEKWKLSILKIRFIYCFQLITSKEGRMSRGL